ncbi:hypothetical protein PTTG_00383 [Puccinia triticina 1-1 BBBD Race 1]|uniref:Rossman fold oxidoreductase n=2 Tax=Puccinia triticina TaxID=208348 RepID=A0A0C4EI17_PUCT1|nr:uncharacterized protein PtA15_8A479 [Puccinia triticina]OAV98338.1 hypothetical protein PTTG_00383 [Puccinia triticina 1-1 BBBD Race 1]WAQ87575.1 hypothetical protein PtA15_8A479 [Puccinia triticina]
MANVAVIQGSSRGIGLALTRHLLKHTKLQVVATSRTPQEGRAQILEKLENSTKLSKRLHNLELDVQDEQSIALAAGYVKENFGQNLRLLINVSGVLLPEKSILKIQKGEMQKTFEVNTFGHLLTYKHFVPLLPLKVDPKPTDAEDPSMGLVKPEVNVLASLSARVGSIGDNSLGGWYSYRSSKTALNQIIVTLQNELAARSSISPTVTVALHPGTVAGTELSQRFVPKDLSGSKQGIHDTETAASSLLNVISKLGIGDGGQFFDYKGENIVW